MLPRELEDVVSKEFPGKTKVLRNKEFFVFFAWFVNKILTKGPSGGKNPFSLRRMKLELFNSSTLIHGTDIVATIFGYPVNTFSSEEKN
jgi:hypothetical protein